MKKKNVFFLIVIVLIFGLIMVGCNRTPTTNSSAEKTKQKVTKDGKLNINLGTATTTGVFYPLGAALAKMWNDKLPDDVTVSSQATDGGVENLNLMKQGKLNMGFTTVDVLYHAYNGVEEFKGNAYKDVRVLSVLYPSICQIVVRKDMKINSIADLKGKKFVPGAPGSSTKILAEQVFGSYGMTLDDVNPQYVGFTEAANLMRNKQIAGTIMASGAPASAAIEMITTASGKLLGIGDDQIQILTKKYPWLYKYTIPAGTYEGQNDDVTTVAQNIMLVVPKDMPDGKVYKLTKALWENIKPIGDVVAAAKGADLKNATTGLSGIPLHPGAKKFYKEMGVIK